MSSRRQPGGRRDDRRPCRAVIGDRGGDQSAVGIAKRERGRVDGRPTHRFAEGGRDRRVAGDAGRALRRRDGDDGRRRGIRAKRVDEHDVNPVVLGIEGVGRERAAGAVTVDAVAAVDPARKTAQRRIVHAGGEVGAVHRIVTDRGLIGGDVGGVRRDRNRSRQRHLLPTRRGLVGEGHGRQTRAGPRPQVSDVRAGVGRELVKAQSGDVTVGVGLELRADLDCRPIRVGSSRHR